MVVLRSIAVLLASAAVVHAQPASDDGEGNTPELLPMGAAKLEAVFASINETNRSISLKDAESLYQRAASLDTKNVAPFYWLGVIGWLRWHSASGALVKAADVATQRRSIADLECVVELQPNNHNAMAYLYLSLRMMAHFEGSPEARLRDEAEADAWRERALSAAAANYANRLVPYPKPSTAAWTIPAPMLYSPENGAVELIVLERMDPRVRCPAVRSERLSMCSCEYCSLLS